MIFRCLLVVTAASALLAPPLADACVCTINIAKAKDASTVVFIGTITKQKESKSCDAIQKPACGSVFTYTVAVEGVFKGTVGKTVTVKSGRAKGTCSTGLIGRHGKGNKWLFFSKSAAEPFELRICGGTLQITPKLNDFVTQELGAPKAP
ncbi:MAG TPA: hypothetical protein VIV11_23280 [Kofleriaceae bacterium]